MTNIPSRSRRFGRRFLVLWKVAFRWLDEVEGATTSRVKAQVSEARTEPTDTQREVTELWGEVAENKKLLTQVLAQQRELMAMCAGAPSNVSATLLRPSAPAPRRRYGDLECYQCHQKGHTRGRCPMASLNQFLPHENGPWVDERCTLTTASATGL